MIPERINRFALTCVDATYPTRCWQCEEMYCRERSRAAPDGVEQSAFNSFGVLMADYLCSRCADLFEPVQTPLCCKCGLSFTTEHGIDHECTDCMEQPFAFESARAAGLLNPMLKTLIHQYKYHGRTELAQPLARLLWEALHRFYDVRSFDLILPVPLHWFRQSRRGFNQSVLLLRQWMQLTRLQDSSFVPARVAENVLHRHRHTPSQTLLGRKRRIANLKSAFKVKDPETVRSRNLLLVDDVLTTGATVDACARVLKSAGAASVNVLTVARAV